MSYPNKNPKQWPLPGQADPNLTPCAFCRRRLRVNGRPVFASCSCKADGPRATVAKLVAGAAVLAVGLWWWARRRK